MCFFPLVLFFRVECVGNPLLTFSVEVIKVLLICKLSKGCLVSHDLAWVMVSWLFFFFSSFLSLFQLSFNFHGEITEIIC